MILAPLLFAAVTQPLWAPAGVADDADAHVAFRGKFETGVGPCEIRMLGASGYLVWLDGKLVADGPARFAKPFPEYQALKLTLAAGVHVLAVHAHNDGVTTRMLAEMKPFIWFDVHQGVRSLPIEWRCQRFPGYRARTRRISDILGWIDWVDTRPIWPNWEGPGFDDHAWPEPVETDPGIGPITRAKTEPVRISCLLLKPIAQGKLAETYGYETDDPAVRFFLRDLSPKELPSQGIWCRYDLGRVRLGRPRFTMDLTAGTVVEFAQCEALRSGRVHPWITLSGSTTCNFDHFVARGGPQEFMPATPKGGRYLEVHILTTAPVKFLSEEFLERTYYGEPQGSFECDDPLINRIWRTGVETLRACSEDALVDCPTRERGEWTGDVASVATDICGVAYSDLSLSRRALVQAAQAARSDGLVAGVGPGDPGYLSTYAAQWVTACVHYYELTGDKSLLDELYPAARKNVAAFEAKLTPTGLRDDLGWGFVDWGYVRSEGPSDMALNLHYAMALKSMIRWDSICSGQPAADEANLERITRLVSNWLRVQISKPGGWRNVGYHCDALALLAGFVPLDQRQACIEVIEKHLLTCFPNDIYGPRLSDPGQAGDRFMTPYFCHFAFDALLQNGETDFVLGQYRKCWGWALDQGVTTWLEVFDTRWSHCHDWSGCPTWQLSRFVLGVRPRFDLGPLTYALNIQPGSLKHANGSIPMPNGKSFAMEWTRSGKTLSFTLQTPTPIKIRFANGTEIEVRDRYTASIQLP